MTDSRPLYRPEVRWITGDAAIPPLNRAHVESLAYVAESVVRQCAEWISRAPYVAVPAQVNEITGAYAAGVAEVLHWLSGATPAPSLVDLLDLPTVTEGS